MNPLEDEEDRWPDEPEELDPDSFGPENPDPTANPDGDVAGTLGATADVDEELFRAFWGAVVFLNVAVAALAVGALLVYFRGGWSTGGPALVVGAVAALFAARYYLRGRRHLAHRGDEPDSNGRRSAGGDEP